MSKRLTAVLMIFAFVLSTLSACVIKKNVPPGQIKKQTAPGQQKKKNR